MPIATQLSRSAVLLATSMLLGAAPAPAPPRAAMPPPDNQKLAHDIFRDIVEVRSVHGVGTKAVADILVRYLKANGFAAGDIHELADPKYPNQVNVVVRLHGKTKAKPVLWYGHLDVVEARPEDWSLPPFKFTEKDGYFYGRGTSDMKDQDAATAASLIRLKTEGFVPDRDIIVAFTADEEVGEEEDGLWYLLRDHRDLVDAEMLINPDGDSGELKDGRRLDFGVETSEKTYATFTLEATNRGGHSSEPRPDNAIYQLADGLVRLSKYWFPYKTNATTRLYFAKQAELEQGQRRADMLALAKSGAGTDTAVAARLAQDVPLNAILHTTCVATMLAAGHQENALPQRAQATVQCRIFPDESVEQTRATLVKVIADPAISVKTLGLITFAPESPPTPKLMASVEKVVHSMWPGVPVLPEMAAGASDSIFARNAGIPAYGISGGWIDVHDIRAHGRDERREKNAFYESVEFTYRLMKELSEAP
jgi:acetylornithine deacetylase/succinyl-diaminopimelate desuccinylase-like protein